MKTKSASAAARHAKKAYVAIGLLTLELESLSKAQSGKTAGGVGVDYAVKITKTVNDAISLLEKVKYAIRWGGK